MFRLTLLLTVLAININAKELLSAQSRLSDKEYNSILFKEKKNFNIVELKKLKETETPSVYLEVTKVTPGTWQDAGLSVGDKLLKLNDYKLVNSSDYHYITQSEKRDLHTLLVQKPKGQTIKIDFQAGNFTGSFSWSTRILFKKMLASQIKTFEEVWINDMLLALTFMNSNIPAAETAISKALGKGVPKNELLIFILAEINKNSFNIKKATSLYELLKSSGTELGSLSVSRLVSIYACFSQFDKIVELIGKTDIFIFPDLIQYYVNKYKKIKDSGLTSPDKSYIKKDLILKGMGIEDIDYSKGSEGPFNIKKKRESKLYYTSDHFGYICLHKPIQNGLFQAKVNLKRYSEKKSEYLKTISFNLVDKRHIFFEEKQLYNGAAFRKMSVSFFKGEIKVCGPEPIFTYIIMNDKIMNGKTKDFSFECFNGLVTTKYDKHYLMRTPIVNVERELVTSIKVVGALLDMKNIQYIEYQSSKELTEKMLDEKKFQQLIQTVISGSTKDRQAARKSFLDLSKNDKLKAIKALDPNDPEQSAVIQELNKQLQTSKKFKKHTLL